MRVIFSPRSVSVLALLPAFITYPAHAEDSIKMSVVKVFATQRAPDVFRPWTKLPPKEVSGSGVVIDRRQILTSAHVVRFATQVYVQGFQGSKKVAAKVIATAPAVDLAVLKPEGDEFFTNRPALPMAEPLPSLKEKVAVYGYPIGGTELSITEGVISRIDFAANSRWAKRLVIQVDAALNPGNSGGPAVSNNQIVGVAFSKIQRAESVGYLVPVEEIKIFLTDIEDGRYDGKLTMFESVQTVENDALRAKLGLAKEIGGGLVKEPYSSEPSYPLKEWDVITHVGDCPIEENGKVRVRDDLSLDFRYLVQKAAKNGKVNLTILRNGKEIKIELPLCRERNQVLRSLVDEYPRYFIYGPLVFSPASLEYLLFAGARHPAILEGHESPLLARRNDRMVFDGEEIVVVASAMFPHKITRGYDDPITAVVAQVNDVPIRNLRHLVETLRDASGPHIVFKFADRNVETLVFRREEIVASTEEVLNDNGIRQRCSDDLQGLWEKK